MKADILEKLEALLENEDILKVRKDFKQLSSQYKALIEHNSKDGKKNSEESNNDEASEDSGKDLSGSKDTTDSNSSKEDAPHEVDEKSEVEQKTPSDVENAQIEVEKPTESADPEKDIEIPKESSNEHTESAPKTDELPTGQAEDSNSPSTEDERFKEITALFKKKVKTAIEEVEKIEKETVKKANELIKELEELVKNEENIGKAFASFNAIQDHWKALPKVSNDSYRDLNAAYNKQVEFFFYNINIYKELKDLDLKHNLEQKLLVLEDQRKLIDINDIRLLEVEVRLNQDRWNEIGPTFKEEWDKIKDEFWTITREIYRKIQHFYNERREAQEKNLEAKKALLEKLIPYISDDYKSQKQWQQKTKEVIDLQKEWKLIGHVPKEHSKALWKEFRTNCDKFFNNKRAFFDEEHKVQLVRKEAKQKIVEKAESLKDSTDWGSTSKTLANLHKEWKEVGPASHRDENKLWYKFRKACDHFFEARNAQRAEENAEQKENLEAKTELINEVTEFEPGEDRKATLAKLKEFNERWRAIGHVPFKQKNSINKAFMAAMDSKYGGLDIDKRQKEKIKFENKVQNLKHSGGSDHLLRKEEDSLRFKISKLENEVIRYETNIGFFASSKGADKFKADIEKNIDKAKDEINELKSRLKMLRETN